MGLQSNFNFTIEEHDPQGRWPFEVHAGANNITVARAAYREMSRQSPERLIILRQGMRVVLRNDQDEETGDPLTLKQPRPHGAE